MTRSEIIKGMAKIENFFMARAEMAVGDEKMLLLNWAVSARDAAEALKAQKPAVAYWIPCNGKSHIWYCSGCGEKINYNDARRTYKTEKKPVEAVNRYCRGCGATMVKRPTDEQRKAPPAEI